MRRWIDFAVPLFCGLLIGMGLAEYSPYSFGSVPHIAGVLTTSPVCGEDVDVALSNPNVLYAICDCRGPGEGVYRSNDKGQTWKKVNQQRVRAAYDFCMVKVSPDDEDEIPF